MPVIDIEKLKGLQRSQLHIRNVCILAHVDHGKTTLADSLIASNGIISQKLAGKLRYMDSRKDEQVRGITMKSSSISLYYQGYWYQNEFLINLIDSPGHFDFSSEVSTAVRLCDGAIIVVDVVEGVCAQTRVCLQQAYTEKLKPILVLNKIDRLILERKMTPLDAYYHLIQLLEQVNAVMGNIFASDVMANEVQSSEGDYVSGLEESDDSNLYFCPLKYNVIFASAIDGWAFILLDFAKMYSRKLGPEHSGILVPLLVKALWGDYFYSVKDKCCKKGAQEKGKKPMFVQFVLENIWALYETIVVRKDREKIPAIANKLDIKLTARDLRHTDGRVQLQAIFSQWLPLSRAVLEMIPHNIKIPIISEEKAKRLMCSLNQDFETFPEETKKLTNDFQSSSPSSENVIVFVSKMFSVDRKQLPSNKSKCLSALELQELRAVARRTYEEKLADGLSQVSVEGQGAETTPTEDIVEESDEVFIAFARVYSGTLKTGAKLFVLGPKHDPRTVDPSNPLESQHVTEIEIGELYLLMGRELELLDEVPAGNIVGIGGLQNHILKTATLCSNIFCPPFTELTHTATPILRVAVEPQNPVDMPKLVKGLKLLNQADACVQVLIQETGEHVIVTLGEVHLERCIQDLEETFAKVKLNVSEPIVPFRETIVPKETVDMVNEAIVEATPEKIKNKIVTISTSNKQSNIRILAIPLPDELTDLLEKNSDLLKALSSLTHIKSLPDHAIRSLDSLKESITAMIKEQDDDYLLNIDGGIIDKVWSIGPKKCGPNLLLNFTESYRHHNFWETDYNRVIEEQEANVNDPRQQFDAAFINGFQMATLAGPLCEEPLRGVSFIVYDWTYENRSEISSQTTNFGPFSGESSFLFYLLINQSINL